MVSSRAYAKDKLGLKKKKKLLVKYIKPAVDKTKYNQYPIETYQKKKKVLTVKETNPSDTNQC